jgi:asparagine synthetase B (glutamine-hydrolysing)
MCGIFFSASPRASISPSNETVRNLESRGPNSIKEHYVAVAIQGEGVPGLEADLMVRLTFVSTVLALRGDHIQIQPMIDESTGSVFCWNGEAWKINGQTLTGNDTVHVFQSLLQATKTLQSATNGIENVLTNIAGPYAFVFYDALSHTVYFGRDRLGRRSLMVSKNQEGEFVLASTSIGLRKPCREVDTTGIFQIKLSNICDLPKKLEWTTPSPDINGEAFPAPTLYTRPTPSTVDALLYQLKASLRLRVTDIPTLSQPKFDQIATKVAILFSGGLDCTLLARLVNDLLPVNEAIDLINVAFENPRALASTIATATASPFESCPDRRTSRSSFTELAKVCPHRHWRFVAIDIPFTETSTHRPTIIDLMHPHNTEMDLSIATALYFAARGQGSCLTDPSNLDSLLVPYTTPARVLISGLGADELFAGYTRHATAFSRRGFPGLVDELELDFTRIGSRNLGRDDRVMSHWGKEVRYPYLDEGFVTWALALPAWEKCGFRAGKEIPKHSEGVEGKTVEKEEDLDPAKMLLRLAAWRLGMRRVAGERKRAIQFGARTAKMEVGGKKKGTDTVV